MILIIYFYLSPLWCVWLSLGGIWRSDPRSTEDVLPFGESRTPISISLTHRIHVLQGKRCCHSQQCHFFFLHCWALRSDGFFSHPCLFDFSPWPLGNKRQSHHIQKEWGGTGIAEMSICSNKVQGFRAGSPQQNCPAAPGEGSPIFRMGSPPKEEQWHSWITSKFRGISVGCSRQPERWILHSGLVAG